MKHLFLSLMLLFPLLSCDTKNMRNKYQKRQDKARSYFDQPQEQRDDAMEENEDRGVGFMKDNDKPLPVVEEDEKK